MIRQGGRGEGNYSMSVTDKIRLVMRSNYALHGMDSILD